MSDAAGDPIVDAYARAIVGIAHAEGALERVEDELFRFARIVEGRTELRERLTDERLGAQRVEIVDDLLARGGGAHPATAAALGYIVHAGRARQLRQIADGVVAMAAAERNESVAEVRSAVQLDADQQRRLADALGRTSGQRVSVKVVVDPTVVGGLVVTMGDTVIDGSVARRLASVRTALTSA